MAQSSMRRLMSMPVTGMPVVFHQQLPQPRSAIFMPRL